MPACFTFSPSTQFDECYHLAAQSFVAESFADGFSTMDTNINGTHYVLAALRGAAAQVPVLFRRIERNVRQGARDAAARKHALPSAQSLWRQQSRRVST